MPSLLQDLIDSASLNRHHTILAGLACLLFSACPTTPPTGDGDEPSQVPTESPTPVDPTAPPTATPVDPTAPPTATPVEPTVTPTATPVDPTAPPTATPVDPTAPPTATPVDPTVTPTSPPMVTPTPEPTPRPDLDLSIVGQVVDLEGLPLPATVRLDGGLAQPCTGEGAFRVSLSKPDVPATLCAEAVGYATNCRTVTLDGSAPPAFQLVLSPVVRTLVEHPELSGMVVLESGARIHLPADAFRDASGEPVEAPILVESASIIPDQDLSALPELVTMSDGGGEKQLEVHSALELRFSLDGEALELALPVEVVFPLAPSTPLAHGADVPLYYFETTLGRWVKDGLGTVDLTGDIPVVVASLSHFTWWTVAEPISSASCLTGSVTDHAGVPLPGITVQAEGVDYAGFSSATTDSDGRYCIPVKLASHVDLTAIGMSPSGWYHASAVSIATGSSTASCANGGCTPVSPLVASEVPEDADQDGTTVLEGDCDDSDPTSYPGGIEACDGRDNDCDGDLDDGFGDLPFYPDQDGDGYGDLAGMQTACVLPPEYVSDSSDCDDLDAAISPGASEVCNAVDDDCDGQLNEGVTLPWYLDSDDDGFGTSSTVTTACTAPMDFVARAGDCNDTDSQISPDEAEVCDGSDIDEDCNGSADESDPGLTLYTWYRDVDSDGFGDPTQPITTCESAPPIGYTSIADDCNDQDAATYPGSTQPSGRDCDAKALYIGTVVGDGTLDVVDNTDALQSGLSGSLTCSDGTDNLYVTDSRQIRKVTKSGWTTLFAGTGAQGTSGDGGPASAATFYSIRDIKCSDDGSIYVADKCKIRKIDAEGTITTWAGTGTCANATLGANRLSSSINFPSSLSFEASGAMLIVEKSARRVIRIDTSGMVSLAAGNGGTASSGDGGDATLASLAYPEFVVAGAVGTFYVTEALPKIRKVLSSGIITTVAGTGTVGTGGSVGIATSTDLGYLSGMVLDSDGNLLLSEHQLDRILKLDDSGLLSIVAGAGSGFSGDGGLAAEAFLDYPTALSRDASGHIFFCDAENYRIRMLTDCSEQTTWYLDADEDGYGADSSTVTSCFRPAGYRDAGGDCDDDEQAVSPGAAERCDQIDNNCNGLIDDDISPGSGSTTDDDGDGFAGGDPCSGSAAGLDCDDSDPAMHPRALETYNGLDDNCDGMVDGMAARAAFGDGFSLALGSDGTVWTWGTGSSGELGTGIDSDYQDLPTQVLNVTNAVAIAAGTAHAYALTSDGQVWSWGNNYSGQLGRDEDQDSSSVPAPIPGLQNITQVVSNDYCGMALDEAGVVWGWGSTGNARACGGTRSYLSDPEKLTGIGKVLVLAAGYGTGAAITSDRKLYTWGDNTYGQLGIGSSSSYVQTPGLVSALSDIVAISMYTHAVAMRADGQVYTWGNNSNGQLGDGRTGTYWNRNTPYALGGLPDAMSIAASRFKSSLAVRADGDVWFWGYSWLPEAQGDTMLPVKVTGISSMRQTWAGNGGGVAESQTNMLWSWGRNAGLATPPADPTLCNYNYPEPLAGVP